MKPFRPLQAAPITALLVALLATLPAQAQVYQYKDASGKTVISDRPPPGAKVPARTFSGGGTEAESAPATNGAPAAAPGAATAAPKTLAERDLEFKKRQQEQRDAAEKAQKEAANKVTRKEDCERAKRQLQLLESGERIASRDDKGERVFVEDEQRAAETERARKFVADACK